MAEFARYISNATILTTHELEFIVRFLNITVLCLNSILNSTRDRIVDAENRSLNQFDLPSSVSSQSICSASIPGKGCLSALPIMDACRV